jgi:CubicO group peptidase (beta-lactamase class C family)
VRYLWKSEIGGPHVWHGDALWDEAHGLPWKVSGQGDSTGGFGAHFTARDLAKLGLLYLAGGCWDGERLLPEAYVAASTRWQSGGGWPEHAPYGYLWWVPVREGNEAQHAYYGSGYGGKYLYVVPQLDLVIVLLSTSEQGPGEGQRNLITRYILPAVLPGDSRGASTPA